MAAQQTEQEGIDALVGAAHGDLAQVKAVLAEHPDWIGAESSWHETPLQAAAHCGQRAIVGYLLAHGAELDICAAAMLGLNEKVAGFLADDPDAANAVGAHGLTALYHAIIGNQRKTAEVLLASGADINGGSASKPLHAAAAMGNLVLAEWLLEHGAQVNAPGMQGKTPLAAAEAQQHEPVAELLRRNGGTE